MKEHIYSAEFETHQIKISTQESYLPPKLIESIWLDGQLVESKSGSPLRMFASSTFDIEIAGSIKKVELREALKPAVLKMGYQILVDEILVAGDQNIRYPNPSDIQDLLRRGYFKYFFKHGFLFYGIPMGIILTTMDVPDNPFKIVFKFLYVATFMGLALSYMNWRALKKTFGEKSKL